MLIERRDTSALRPEEKIKQEPVYFVWFDRAVHYRICKDERLSCQVVHEKAFMPKGVLAKIELSEIQQGCSLETLAKLYPAPEIVDAQG